MKLSTLTRGLFAAVALTAASGAANALPVFTPNGDPFPAGSSVTIGGGFATPFGAVDSILLDTFSASPAINPNGGSPIYTYTAAFHTIFKDAPGGNAVGYYNGTSSDFTVRIDSRGGLFNVGTFVATLLSATFNGVVTDLTSAVVGNLTAQLNPALFTTGTATFAGPVVVGGNLGLTADTSFTVNSQYSVNGGPFTNLPPLPGNSTPPAAVSEPASLALLVPGLLGLFGARRRVAAAA